MNPNYLSPKLAKKLKTVEQFNANWHIEYALNPPALTRLIEHYKVQSLAGVMRLDGITVSNGHILRVLTRKKNGHDNEHTKLNNYFSAINFISNNFILNEQTIFTLCQLMHLPKPSRETLIRFFEAIKLCHKVDSPFLQASIVYFLLLHTDLFKSETRNLGALILPAYLASKTIDYLTYVSLIDIISQDIDKFLYAFKRTHATWQQGHQELDCWYAYMINILTTAKDHLIIQCNKEKNPLQRWVNKLSPKLQTDEAIITVKKPEHLTLNNLPKLCADILALFDTHPRITTTDIAAHTHAPKSTIKANLNRLVITNQITRHGKGRGCWYTVNNSACQTANTLKSH